MTLSSLHQVKTVKKTMQNSKKYLAFRQIQNNKNVIYRLWFTLDWFIVYLFKHTIIIQCKLHEFCTTFKSWCPANLNLILKLAIGLDVTNQFRCFQRYLNHLYLLEAGQIIFFKEATLLFRYLSYWLHREFCTLVLQPSSYLWMSFFAPSRIAFFPQQGCYSEEEQFIIPIQEHYFLIKEN